MGNSMKKKHTGTYDMTEEGGLTRKESFAACDTIKYRTAFDRYDTDNTGCIQGKDVENVVQDIGYRLTGKQVKDILKKHKLKDTSDVTFEQFLDLVPRNEADISTDEHKLADLREKFQRYDLDKNGTISLNEAQWALQMELDVSVPTALRLLGQFIKLDYANFCKFYKQVQDKKLEMYEMFGKYDTDKDGLISSEEAHNILHKELGYTLERSQAMVRRFDINQDGMVSYIEFAEFYIAVQEKKEKIRETFKKYDSNGSGSVSCEQARHILQTIFGFSPEKSKRTVRRYAGEGDTIQYEQFVEFYAKMEEERVRLLEEFSKYDEDGDGRISMEEFKHMTSKRGLTDAETETLMAGYDVDHDGYLNFEEFKCYLNFS